MNGGGAMIRYSQRAPCQDCPFRLDVPPYLRPGRAAEIVRLIYDSRPFVCHENHAQHCAGALIMLEHAEVYTLLLVIARQLGAYDPALLHMDAPVATSPEAFIAHQDGPACNAVALPTCATFERQETAA